MTVRRELGFLLLWVLSLGIRLVFLMGMDTEETLYGDAYHYLTLAWNLVHHGVYSDALRPPYVPHVDWPPGYPWMLAPFFVGDDFLSGVPVAMVGQVVATSFMPLLVVVLARRLVSGAVAWVPGVLSACCPVLVTSSAFLVTEAPFTLLLMALLILVARQIERSSTSGALVAGALAGYLVLIRSFAVLLPVVLGVHLAARGLSEGRRRAAVLFVLAALVVVAPWEMCTRRAVARGAPRSVYLAKTFAISLYPDLRCDEAPRGYPYMADPRYAEFSASMPAALAELWRRLRVDPWVTVRWHLVGRWLTLWEFDEIQGPPIHVYEVQHGLFRPASRAPDGRREPLGAVYWLFRGLYWVVVPLVLRGALVALRQRRRAFSPANRTVEMLYLVLVYAVGVQGALLPLPRYMWPMRPILFVLATATACRLLHVDRDVAPRTRRDSLARTKAIA